MRSSVFTLFPPVVRGTLVLTGRSLHCRITAGLASMDMPLLVSSVESQLWGFCSWFYRASWLAQGVSPCFTYCPTTSGLKRSSCGFSASSFAVSLRDGVTLPGRVCLSPRSERRPFFHLPGVWLESSRWGHPVGSGFVPDLDRNEDLLCTFPCGWCLAFAMGSPILGRMALFCALGRNEGFFHSSILSCFAMGSPCGSSVWFPALDRNEAVFG